MKRKTFWIREEDGTVNEYFEDTGELTHPLPDLPKDNPHKLPYSEQLADIICQKIIEGIPMSEISREDGFPSLHMIARWKRLKPEFNEALIQAREARAELLRDQALSTATSSLDKDEVPAAKLAVDTLKWAAEKDDPRTYGNKVDISGSVAVATWVIETGIRRGPSNLQSNPSAVNTIAQGETDEAIHREGKSGDYTEGEYIDVPGDGQAQGDQSSGSIDGGIQQLDEAHLAVGSRAQSTESVEEG